MRSRQARVRTRSQPISPPSSKVDFLNFQRLKCLGVLRLITCAFAKVKKSCWQLFSKGRLMCTAVDLRWRVSVTCSGGARVGDLIATSSQGSRGCGQFYLGKSNAEEPSKFGNLKSCLSCWTRALLAGLPAMSPEGMSQITPVAAVSADSDSATLPSSSYDQGPSMGAFRGVQGESAQGLHFSSVGFGVAPPSWLPSFLRESGGEGDTQILLGVAGEVLRGESLALLGPSGAGKSTLLRVLTNKNTGYGQPSGIVHLDDQPLSATVLRTSSAFVEQEDSSLPALLTPREVSLPVAPRHMGRVGPCMGIHRKLIPLGDWLGCVAIDSLLGRDRRWATPRTSGCHPRASDGARV